MRCKTCGNEMIGDGYKTVVHCENVDIFEACAEPDANALHCKPEGPESTEDHRVWHSGPPPYVGWWQASMMRAKHLWSWWDGTQWSNVVSEESCAERANLAATFRHAHNAQVEWNDYWPADARVPRLAPEDFEIGARWTCVKPLFADDFVGMELRVCGLGPHTVTWDGPQHTHSSSISLLPGEQYVPSRCVGPQTRWDFPVAKGGRCG